MSLPAPFARGPSLSKKASQSFASADAKAIQFVFCRDMCVAENTLRGVSVELSAISGQLRRRAQRSFLEKVAKPLFRQSQPPLQGGHDMASVIARAARNASPDAPKPRFVSCLPCKGRWVGASRAGGILPAGWINYIFLFNVIRQQPNGQSPRQCHINMSLPAPFARGP